MIVAASRMLSCCIYSLYSDVLYKIEKLSFTKDFFRKKKTNIKYLLSKNENII